MKEQFLPWRRYLWRWLVLLGAALVMFSLVFVASKVILEPLLQAASNRTSPQVAKDFIQWIESLGPVGIGLACSALVLRIGASWPKRARPSGHPNSTSPAVPESLTLKQVKPILKWLMTWTGVFVFFVLTPILAIYEQLPSAGGLTFDAVVCFAFGGVLVVATASQIAPNAERLAASTIGTLWRSGVVDLRDEWRSTYHYRSGGDAKTAVQIMTITQIGRLAHARNIGGTSPHKHAIRMTINGDYVTGEWRNTVHAARHHGVFQLRIKANGREMIGRWVGFDSDANIQDGHWIWERL